MITLADWPTRPQLQIKLPVQASANIIRAFLHEASKKSRSIDSAYCSIREMEGS